MRVLFTIFTALGALGALSACAQIQPSAIERADGTIQFCPNPYNRHQVLLAAREYCAPEPAESLGFEGCPNDELVAGWVFACRYKADYKRLEIEDVRLADDAPASDAENAPADEQMEQSDPTEGAADASSDTDAALDDDATSDADATLEGEAIPDPDSDLESDVPPDE